MFGDVLVCPVDDLRRRDVTDVARLAEIVPFPTLALLSGLVHARGSAQRTRDNLDKVRLDLQDLLPAIIPERLAGTVPILLPLRQI